MTTSHRIASPCPDCGAQNPAGTTRCWLCEGELPDQPNQFGATDEITEELIDAELVPERPGASRFSYALTAVFAAMTIVAIAAGLAKDAPGLSVLVLIVGLPALLVTVVRMGWLRRKGKEVTWTNRIITFVLSSIAVVGMFVLLVVAAIGALFIYCVVAISGGGRMFH